MKKYITLTALLVAGSAFANAAQEDWTNWILYHTFNQQSQGGYFSNRTIGSFGETGDLALRADFSNLSYTENSSAGSYFLGIKSGSSYYSIRITEDSDRNVYFAGATNNQQTISASSISGDWTARLEYDGGEDILSAWLGDTCLGTVSVDLSSATFAIGAGSPPENWSANNLSNSFTYDSGMKLSYSTTLIPEPSAFGLLAGLGALALVGTRRRRR